MGRKQKQKPELESESDADAEATQAMYGLVQVAEDNPSAPQESVTEQPVEQSAEQSVEPQSALVVTTESPSDSSTTPASVVDPAIDPHDRIRGQIDAIAALRSSVEARFGAEADTKAIEPRLAATWLREIQEQNQRVQIAFADLESARLEAKARKTTHDEEVQKLTKLIADQKRQQDEWSRPLPLLDGVNGSVNGQANGHTNGHTNGSDASQSSNENTATSPATIDTDAWKNASIAELNLPGKLPALLEENGITTIGELEAKRASRDGLRGIKGVGQAKVDLIEQAVTDWLSVQRDAQALAAAGKLNSAVQDLSDQVGADIEVIASRDGQADEVIVTATANVAEQDAPPEFDDI